MRTEIELPLTDFEIALRDLEGLTQCEIAERVTSQISDKDARNFAILRKGLSIEALRLLSATTIARQRRIHVVDRR